MSKTCRKCGEEKPLDAFAKDASQKGGYRAFCKNCHAENARAARSANPERHRLTDKRYRERKKNGEKTTRSFNPDTNYDYKRKYLNDIKESSGCLFCGEMVGICLSFHHINPNEKSFDVSDVVHRTVQELDAEIAKCVVVCENCHRKLHAGMLSL